jgi:succinate dehydrogenase/fumarate reductase flavoprotein subunit
VSEKRFVISMNAEMEELVKQIQKHMQDNMPEHLQSMRVSKSLAVETAIKQYAKTLENA